MELKQYFSIIRRWWWIPLGLALAAGVLTVVMAPKPQTTYSATMRAIVSVPPEPRTPEKFAYEGYYAWVASEYLVDDLAEIVKTQRFADDVAKEINDPNISAAVILGQQATKRTHRLLSVSVTGPDGAQVQRIADAIVKVLDRDSSKYIAQLQLGAARIEIVDKPVTAGTTTGLRGNLDVVARAGLGLFAGLAIAFLLQYLDSTIRDSQDVTKTLGLAVLGEVPGEKPRFFGLIGR